jgi:hypothetical protein
MRRCISLEGQQSIVRLLFFLNRSTTSDAAINAHTTDDKASKLSSDAAYQQRMRDAITNAWSKKTPTLDRRAFLDYEIAQYNCVDYDDRLAAQTGYAQWEIVRQALNELDLFEPDGPYDWGALRAIVSESFPLDLTLPGYLYLAESSRATCRGRSDRTTSGTLRIRSRRVYHRRYSRPDYRLLPVSLQGTFTGD